MSHPAIILAIAYLLGSIPFGYILVRLFLHQDIRATGSGNIGATNVARSGAKGLGIATLALDALKGVAAVLIAKHFFAGTASLTIADLAALAALAAILGHMFPVWLGFKGGKGVATALGVYLALCWPAALCALAVFIVVLVLTKYVSLASVLGALTLPVFFFWLSSQHSAIISPSVLVISLLVIVKHHKNIMRLKSGTESKFGSGKKSKPSDPQGTNA
jgi:acyl phosphate:glycerol-3-phosphate acyltransferase